MSKMKYLVVLAVCAGMALLVGAPAFATDQVFFTEDLSTNPAWTTEGAWEYGQPTGVDDDPTAGNTGNYVYGYNIFGPYGKNMPQTNLTSEVIDCSDKVGVRLSFYRWLNVLDGDTANVQVSADGTTWTKVWANTDEDDPEILDSAWSLVGPFDISAVADLQATV